MDFEIEAYNLLDLLVSSDELISRENLDIVKRALVRIYNAGIMSTAICPGQGRVGAGGVSL